MPLLDHFHAPLSPRHPWESFHAVWANAILEQLNATLPPRYFAAIQVHLGSQVEADVAEFDTPEDSQATNGPPSRVAVAAWAPAATATLDVVFPDDIEVQVVDTRDGAVLVAVVELVSPRNKDRATARRAFASKCAAYLQRGVGLIVLDIVTNRQANLHEELVRLLEQPGAAGLPPDTSLYATAYRPVQRQSGSQVDFWVAPLALGMALPILPLALRSARMIPLDLEAAYTIARTRSRL